MTTENRPLPPSRRIANQLRDAIHAGEYQPGERLPSERRLAEQYTAARNTAREAVNLLQAEGLIDVHHGRGVFVRGPAPMVRMGANRYSRRIRSETGLAPFRAEAARQGRQARVDVLDISQVTPPAEVADRLGLSDDATAVQRVNHYFIDDAPVQLGTTYLPWILVEGSVLATEAHTGTGSIYERLEELGHRITAVREEVRARMPTPQEVAQLTVPRGVPVIDLLHTGLDQDGQPFEVTRFVMRADRNVLDYRIPVED